MPSPTRSLSDEAVIGGQGESFGDVLHVELLENLAAVELHGVERAEHLLGYLLHGVALGRERQDLLLLGLQSDGLAVLPAVGLQRVLALLACMVIDFVASLVEELEELDVSGLLVGRERDGAEGEPDAASGVMARGVILWLTSSRRSPWVMWKS